MSKKQIEKLADHIGSMTLGAKKERLKVISFLHKAILKSLAEGKPASIKELAAAIEQSEQEVAEMIPQLPNVELDSHGQVLGLGLSLIPTPHRVQLKDRDHLLYAWCGPDALLLPGRIGEEAEIRSPCYATGKEITIEVGPDGIGSVDPPEAVVSWWPDAIDPQNLRPTGCKNQNFFSSSDTVADWLAEHPGAFAVSVPDTYRIISYSYKRFVTQGDCC